MSSNRYFYMANIKSATAVSLCLKANFTSSPLPMNQYHDVEMADESNF